MKFKRVHVSGPPRPLQLRTLWIGVLAGAAAIAIAPTAGGGLQQNASLNPPSEQSRAPSSNPVNGANDPQASTTSLDAANAERKKLVADESARLLKLATDLKAEVDKTTKYTLSLDVIRKADEIERMARDVRKK
jgi:hypothetical protein